MNKIYQGKRLDNGEIVSGALLYDSDQDCWRIVQYTFEIEDVANPTMQFGVCAPEVDENTIESVLD